MFTSEETATRPLPGPRDGSARPGTMTPVGIIEDRRSSNPPTSVFDPLTIAKAVWKARLLILATTVLGVLVAVAIALVTPKMYVATTQILVDPRDIKVVANEVTPNGLPSEATLALIESQTSVILSSNILSRVIAGAGLDQDPEFNGKRRTGLLSLLPASVLARLPAPVDDPRVREYFVQSRLRHALTVGRETKSFVINLSVDSQDPDKAARLANLTASVFIDEQGRVQSDTARRATTALSSRLSELRQSVVAAEGAVEDYKSSNALVGVGGRLVDDQYITRINDELARVRGNIPSLRVKADSMRVASVEDVVRGTLPEELSSTALVRLRQSYSDLEQQAAVLAARLGPRHPQRIASEGALSAARQAIASELSRIVSSAQTELARAEGTERDLSIQIEDLKGKQIETSGSFVKLRELEREVEASRAVYEAFLLRARETSEQESLNTANVRIISEATPPLEPAGVSRKVVVAAGGIVGFGAGVALAAFFA
ncbi:MAG: GumC family protein, partial [Rhizobiaceae bacterium]|nr:GumC family protein [Rhizobiaceae bacterium]